jgi:hypothetical protein
MQHNRDATDDEVADPGGAKGLEDAKQPPIRHGS